MHLVTGSITSANILQAIQVTFFMALIAASIGIISTGIGFIKKSIPTTIVTDVLMASLMSKNVVNTTANMVAMYVFGLILILVAILFSFSLIHKVNLMEV